MPRFLSFPAPSSWACPLCGTLLTGPGCPACDVDLGSADAVTLWRVDHDLHDLCGIRNDVVHRLLATARPRTASPPVRSDGPGAPAATPVTTVGAPVGRPPGATAGPGGRAAGAGASGSSSAPAAAGRGVPSGSGPSVAEVLVGLGALSLVAAVVVFAAVTWEHLAAWAQGGLLLAATGLVLDVAVACRRRALVATAEALGAVTVALALADVQVARVALEAVASARPVVAGGLAVVALAALLLGARTGIRTLSVAGSGLAFGPAVLVAVGATSVMPLLVVLVAQALVAAWVGAPMGGRGRRWDLEPAVARLGSALCWVLGGAGTLVVGLDELAVAPPTAGPAGPAALLVALAVGSLVVARCRGGRVLAAAGAGVAFVPALLVVAGTGSVTALLWTLAVQGVAAAVVGPATGPERAVVAVGGGACWLVASGGAVTLGLAGLVADPSSGPGGAVALLVALAGASLVVGRGRDRPVLSGAGAALSFVPAPLAAAGTGSAGVVCGVLAAQALAAVVLGAARRVPAVERSAVHLAGLTCWTLAGLGAFALGVAGLVDGSAPWLVEAVTVLVVLAAVAVGGAVAAGWRRDAAGAALVAAVGAVLVATGLGAGHASAGTWVAVVALAGGGLALGAALLARHDPARPWTGALGAAGSAVAVLAVVPGVAAVSTALAYLDVSTPPRAGGIGQGLGDRLALAGSGPVTLAAPATLGQLAALVLLGLAGLVVRAGWAPPLLGVVGVAVALTGPVALDLPVGLAAAALVPLVVAGSGWLLVRPGRLGAVAVEAGLAAVTVAVALGSPPLTVAVTALVAVLAVVLAGAEVRRGSAAAPAWVGGASLLVLGAAVLDGWVLGASGSGPALVLAAAAAVVAGSAPVIERRGGPRAAESTGTVDGIVAIALFGATIGVASVDGLSVVVAVVGLVAGASAVRPTRRPLWLVALASVVVLTWIRLWAAEVPVVEAYALPLAAGLLLAGLLTRPAADRTSWERLGAGLVAAVGPTAVVALIDAGLVRTVAVVAVGLGLAVWGAAGRQQAPLAVGAAAVGAMAVRQLGPVATELPRYVVFAVAGVVLVAVGATFEQRRQALRQARDSFTRLG